MDNRQRLVIVGIDPGITTAVAILDLEGAVVSVQSGRDFDIGRVLEAVTQEGRVVAVGTDVRFSPKMVYKLSAKLGVKVVSPREDMKVGLKQRMTAGFKLRNDHERDALAAALLAHKELLPLIQKVERRLSNEPDMLMRRRVVRLVLKGKSIAAALFEVQEKQKVKKKNKRVRDKQSKTVRFFEENQRVKEENARLAEEVLSLKRRITYLEKNMLMLSVVRAKKEIRERDKRLREIAGENKALEHKLQGLSKDLDTALGHLSRLKGKFVIPRIPALTLHEVQQNIAFIEEGSAVYVHDPHVWSERAIELLRKISCVVIYEKKPPASLLARDMFFIDGKKLSLVMYKNFVIVDKDVVESKKKNADTLVRIIDEYQQSRKEVRLE